MGDYMFEFDLIRLHHQDLLREADERRVLKYLKKRPSVWTKVGDRFLLTVGNLLIHSGETLKARNPHGALRLPMKCDCLKS